MGVADPHSEAARAQMRRHTLVRRIEAEHFDSERIVWNRRMQWTPPAEGMRFRIPAAQLPDPLPAHWSVLGDEGRSVEDLRREIEAELATRAPVRGGWVRVLNTSTPTPLKAARRPPPRMGVLLVCAALRRAARVALAPPNG